MSQDYESRMVMDLEAVRSHNEILRTILANKSTRKTGETSFHASPPNKATTTTTHGDRNLLTVLLDNMTIVFFGDPRN